MPWSLGVRPLLSRPGHLRTLNPMLLTQATTKPADTQSISPAPPGHAQPSEVSALLSFSLLGRSAFGWVTTLVQSFGVRVMILDSGLSTLLSFDLLGRSSLRSARSLYLSIPPRGTWRVWGKTSVRDEPTYPGARSQRHIALHTLFLCLSTESPDAEP